jgi:hypothetical protein
MATSTSGLLTVSPSSYQTTQTAEPVLPITVCDTENVGRKGFIYNVLFLISHYLLTAYILSVTIIGIVLISTNSYNNFVMGLLIMFFVINFMSIICENTILLRSFTIIHKKRYIKNTMEKILVPIQLLFVTYIFNIVFYAVYGDNSYYGCLIVITDCIQLVRIFPSIILFRYC